MIGPVLKRTGLFFRLDMNKKTKHLLLLSILIVLFIVLVVFFSIEYRTTYKKTEVLNSSHSDYSLSIYMIGEPEFPYGYTRWGFKLFKGKTKITQESLSLLNDGAVVSEDNFKVEWSDDSVKITASGSEQEDIKFVVSLKS